MINVIDTKRIIKVQGGFNFRDLGGLPTISGKHIAYQKLIRADELSTLEVADLEVLNQIDVRTVVDFRTQQERAQSVDRLPASCNKEYQLDIISANMDSYIQEIKSGRTDFKQFILDFYKDLVLGENAIEQWQKFFAIIENPENIAIIYHCTAGKDRTGLATALILEALQVERDIIISDYLLSNAFLKDKYASYLQQDPHYAELLLVQSSYLESSYQAIESKYGSVESYLKNILLVDLDKIRALYLV